MLISTGPPSTRRDIKTNNMALNFRGYVELLDFGLAKEVFARDRLHKSLCGTSDYMGRTTPLQALLT